MRYSWLMQPACTIAAERGQGANSIDTSDESERRTRRVVVVSWRKKVHGDDAQRCTGEETGIGW